MEQLSYKLEVFEGPLDLLLTLISKNKLNIYDIPIAELLDQYLNQIKLMQENNMDIASEFLDMASRLVHIKSVSLLPKKEEAEELKRELTGQLIEYQQCKAVAAKLATLINFDNIAREEEHIEADFTYTRLHDPSVLLNAFMNAFDKGKKKFTFNREKIDRIVTRNYVSVNSQVVYILRSLWNKIPQKLTTFFSKKKDHSERVAAFLALLELVKHKRVKVQDKDNETYIKINDGES